MSLWVAERGRIYRGREGQNSWVLDNSNLQLAEDDFESVLSLLEDNEQIDLNPILKFFWSNGRDVLAV